MSSRPSSRGPGRPLAHRQPRFVVRPRHVIILGAVVMGVSGLLLLGVGNDSDGPSEGEAHSISSLLHLPRGRRSLEEKVQQSAAAGRQSAAAGRRNALAAKQEQAEMLGAARADVDSAHWSSREGSQGTRDSGGELKQQDPQVDASGSAVATQKAAHKVQRLGRQQGLLGGTLTLSSTDVAEIQSRPLTRKTEKPKTSDLSKSEAAPEDKHRRALIPQQATAPHEMDDEELLWRASFISLRDPARRPGPRKIAFLFSFNKELFFAPLWAKFFEKHEGKFSVYLHGAEGAGVEKDKLPSVFQDRLVPVETHASATGEPFPHMFAVDAARRLIANALLDMANEWFLIVCDLCIPLHGFDYFYEYFSSSPTRSMVPHQAPSWKNGLDRYLASCFEPLVLQEQWRKGGPWMGLTRRMALNLVADIKFYDRFAACCQPVKRGPTEPCFPLEHYMATVLPILGAIGTSFVQPEEVTNWSTVFEDWWTEPWTGRPFVYNQTSVSEKLIKTMRRCHLGNLCHLQGAHFDPATLPVLLNMTSVLGY